MLPPDFKSGKQVRIHLVSLAFLALVCQQSSGHQAANPLEEALALADWGPEQRATLAAEWPVDSSQAVEGCVRLAQRLRRLEHLLADAASAELAPARVMTGQAVSVRQLSVPREMASRLGVAECYELTVRLTEAPDDLVRVFTLAAPRAWLDQQTLPQPVTALGVRIGAGLVASDVTWWPTAVGGSVNFGHTLLGSLQVDVGGLDAVVDGARLIGREADIFYEVLSATKQIGARQLARFARGNLDRHAASWRQELPARLAKVVLQSADDGRYSVAPLFNDAIRQRGQLFVFDGTVRRAVRIQAATLDKAESNRAPNGVEAYYELELYTHDSQNLPLVFCVLEIPDGFPTGDSIEQEVRLAGFFFKRWAYRTRKATTNSPVPSHDKRQLAPLLIGRAPLLLGPPKAATPFGGIAAGGLFAMALLAICVAIWRYNKADAAFERSLRGRLSESPNPTAFDSLAQSADEGSS